MILTYWRRSAAGRRHDTLQSQRLSMVLVILWYSVLCCIEFLVLVKASAQVNEVLKA